MSSLVVLHFSKFISAITIKIVKNTNGFQQVLYSYTSLFAPSRHGMRNRILQVGRQTIRKGMVILRNVAGGRWEEHSNKSQENMKETNTIGK